MQQFEEFENVEAIAEPAATLWTGRSGRRYKMSQVSEAGGTVMSPARLYALEESGVIRWAGTSDDLIGDHVSRERFRRASANGARMLWLAAPQDPLAVMTLVWDLEGSRHYPDRNAA